MAQETGLEESLNPKHKADQQNNHQEAYEGGTANPPRIRPRKLIVSTVEDHPIGYPRQAAFADSDESFAIYRRFGYIHARLLMHRQDELRELEDKLGDMDKRDFRDEDRQRRLTSREVDDGLSRREEAGSESRSALFDRIEDKVLKYGNVPPLSSPLFSD